MKNNHKISFHPEKPFNDLPMLPPSVELETQDILKKTIFSKSFISKIKWRMPKNP